MISVSSGEKHASHLLADALSVVHIRKMTVCDSNDQKMQLHARIVIEPTAGYEAQHHPFHFDMAFGGKDSVNRTRP